MNFADLKYLSFEIAPYCNMASRHPFCPVNDVKRYPDHEHHYWRCSDHSILSFTAKVFERGFNGLIGFHYYCDPLMDVPRMLSLMNRIRGSIPKSKFILWSNGVLLRQDHRNWLEAFEKVVFTLHDTSIEEKLREITKDLPNVEIAQPAYDDRINIYTCPGRVTGPCIRPSKIELPVNYYGSVRLCCADFRGSVSLGNIEEEDFDKILDGFAEAADMAMYGGIPICRKCRSLHTNPAAVV